MTTAWRNGWGFDNLFGRVGLSKFLSLGLLVVACSVASNVRASQETLNISAFGDSLTAGYGLPPGDDFASKLEAALKAKGHNVIVTNAGVSGDTTTGGLARFDWAVGPNVDAVILELGANDGLRGVSPKIARGNLDKMLTKLRDRNISVLLAGMQAPANWGEDYKAAFDGMYAILSEKFGTLYYPFFLEGVIDKPSLKLADGLHPNAAGVDEIVRRILPKVRDLIAHARANPRKE